MASAALLGLVSCGGLATESASDGDAQCQASVELVVDTSSSMAWTPLRNELARPPQPSRWELTQAALIDALAVLPNTWAVGLTFFPNVPVNSPPGVCINAQQAAGVHPLDATQRATLEARVRAVTSPAGATPTPDALTFAVSALRDSKTKGPHFVILLTDGAPTNGFNCSDDTAVDIALLQTLETSVLELGVRTVVVGLPGSAGARPILSRMSQAGGSAAPGCAADGGYCHIDLAEQEQGLGATLAASLASLCEANQSDPASH